MSNEQFTTNLGNSIIAFVFGILNALRSIARGFSFIFLHTTKDKYIFFTFMFTIVSSLVLIRFYGIAFIFVPFYSLFCIGSDKKLCKKRIKILKGGRQTTKKAVTKK